mgnify:CR=1 FL=1
MRLSATDTIRSLFLALLIGAAGQAATESPSSELNDEERRFALQSLRTALAGPAQEALLQILLTADIVRDTSVDTAFIYDILVRFDPKRYRNMHGSIYPLSFEDQFILWGKRIATYSRSTEWESGRFHLHDISTGQQAWIYTADTRRLVSPPTSKQLRPMSTSRPDQLDKWLAAIHATPTATSLRKMGRWLRLIRYETRDAVLHGSN